MHVMLDIHLVYALDRQHRLQADHGAQELTVITPLRVRVADGLRRAHTRSEAALARRRAGELLTQRG